MIDFMIIEYWMVNFVVYYYLIPETWFSLSVICLFNNYFDYGIDWYD